MNVIAQRGHSFWCDGVDQILVVAAREIRAPDQEPANSTSPTWAKPDSALKENDMSGGVTGAMKNLPGGFAKRDYVAILQPAVGFEGARASGMP